jgi:hypothetical protein
LAAFGAVWLWTLWGNRRPGAEAAMAKAFALLDKRRPGDAYRQSGSAPPVSARELYEPLAGVSPVPSLKSAPGKDLAVALHASETGVGSIIVAIIWMAICGCGFVAFLSKTLTKLSAGSLVGTVLSGGLAAAGLLFCWVSARQLIADRRLPRVEIDNEPAYLGSSIRLRVVHRGRIRLNAIDVSLVCRESAIYSIGTTSRTETAEVYDAPVISERNVNVAAGEEWSKDVDVALPDGPHSLRAPHNEIVWSFRVKADIENWPDYDEHMVFRIFPRCV